MAHALKLIVGILLCASALPVWAEDDMYEDDGSYDVIPLEAIVPDAGNVRAPAKKKPAPVMEAIGPDGTYTKVTRDVEVSVTAVEAPSVDTVGVGRNPELGADLWPGMDFAAVQNALKQLPLDTSSKLARSLVELVVLAPSQAPRGTNAGAWLQLRLQRLMTMESYEALNTLLTAIPQPSRDENWHKYKLTTSLHLHESEPVCALIENAVLKFPTSFWREKHLFCLGYRKEYDKAAAVVEVMREQGHATPLWLQRAILAGAGEQKEPLKPEQTKTLSALDIALLGLADQPLTEEMLPPAVKDYPLMLATHPSLDIRARLRFAEEAVRRGVMEGEDLAQMMEKMTPEEADAASAPPIAPALADALEYHGLQKEYAVKENVASLMAIVKRYGVDKRSLLVSRLYGNEISNLSRVAYRKDLTSAFSMPAFAILFANHMFEDALSWLDIAAKAAPESPVGKGGAGYWRIATALASYDPKNDAGKLASTLNQLRPEQVMPQGTPLWRRLRAILEGLAVPIPEPVRVLLPPLEMEAGAKDITALREAVATGRKGEALMTLARLAHMSQRITDNQLKAALESLRALGLTAEAYQLAHEVLVAELLESL